MTSRTRLVAAIALLSLLCANESRATENDTPGFSFGPRIGTLGYGIEAGYRINKYFGIRASGDEFNYDYNGKVNNVPYKVKFGLASAGLNGDFYPFGGGWRLIAGARIDDNTVKSNATGDVTINGHDYGSTSLNGKVSYENHIAPYAGMGYLGTLFAGLQLSGEVGAMYQGRAHTILSNPDGLVSVTDLSTQANKFNHYANMLEFYPVVELALTYHF